MANQPTKYSKFLVGAASAALVATAVAPVASAADFKDIKGNTHEEAIKALSAAGVVSGYADGTFKPNKTLTRSDVVKMMGKWLVSEGYKVPTDYKTKVRFADLKSTSNDELLQMAALVKDEGLFIGTPDGKLDPAGDITRENMAVVLVRAFDRVHNIDLASYVADQTFKKDVTDLGKAKAEARPAIDVLDFFDITNPAAPAFNPKSTTTRGQFATFIYKTLNADFSKVGSGSVVAGVASIKVVNATTVEVIMKDKVDNINSLNFKIDGLTVSNAAVKQTDDKVVVLTTAVQKGGEKYTVTLNDKAIGTFTGVSAVIPTSISLTENSKQSQVGKEVILSAYVGVKQAGIPVTFNVDPMNNRLNKEQVVEVTTNADGIATFSYTQYNQGTDHVAVYPTGAPALRDLATVYWGVQNILTIEEDKAGNAVANGTKKVYTVTYLDPQTGRAVPNATLNVTFKENIGVDYSAAVKATVTDTRTGVTKTPFQAKSGAKETLAITTDSTGKATFTVSGTNVAVTPMVFADNVSTVNQTGNGIFDAQELVAVANKVTFAGAQLNYALTVTPVGDTEAATGAENGRVYTVKVLNPADNNKVYAGGVINVSLDELMDRNMSTNSKAKFKNAGLNTNVTATTSMYGGEFGQQAIIKLDAKGEASFVLYGDHNDTGTPVIWIDQNNAVNTQSGVLEDGEPFAKSAATFFQNQRVMNAELTAVNNAGKDAKDFPKGDSGLFTFDLTNQSKEVFGNYSGKVTFEIRNTGANALTLTPADDKLVDQNGTTVVGPLTINVGGSTTVVAEVVNGKANLRLSSVEATTASISAHAVTDANWSADARNNNKYVTAETFTASFSGTFIPANFTGTVESVDTVAKDVTLVYGTTKYTVSYKGAEYYYNTSSVQSTFDFFESRLSKGDLVTFTKAVGENGKNKFDIIRDVDGQDVVDGVEANKVTTKITALPAPADLKLANEAAVKEARAAYEALTAAQKTLVLQATTDKLVAAEAKIVELKAADQAGAVFTFDDSVKNAPFANALQIKVGTIANVTPAEATSYKVTYKLADGSEVTQDGSFGVALTIAVVKNTTVPVTIQLVNAAGTAVGTSVVKNITN